MKFLQWVIQFVLGGLKALIGGGGAKAPPKPADVVSEQAATAPTLAATAATATQASTDLQANVQAKEASDAHADQAIAVRDAGHDERVLHPDTLRTDDEFELPG